MSKVIRNSKAFWTILLVSVFCFMVILLAVPAQAEPEVVTPLLSLNPANPVVGPGGSIDVAIQLDNIGSVVYGSQINLSFDPAILQVTGGLLTLGTCPFPSFVQANTANNTTGAIEYVVTQLNPVLPCSGGVVATIPFTCKAEGVSNVTFTSSIISDQNANAITHNTQNGTVTCERAVIDITGTVALQSWPSPTGVKVTLYDSGGIVDGPYTVTSNGAFILHASDETETYRVVARYDRYLSAEKTGITGAGGDVIDVGLATLRAGDINGDGVINVLDLSALGGNYNKVAPQAWVP